MESLLSGKLSSTRSDPPFTLQQLCQTQQTQDVNLTYIRRSEDVLDVFWTSYVRSIYVLCLLGTYRNLIIYKDIWRAMLLIPILGLAITSQNYMQAMDLLQKCYGNPQLIVSSPINAIAQLSVVIEQNSMVALRTFCMFNKRLQAEYWTYKWPAIRKYDDFESVMHLKIWRLWPNYGGNCLRASASDFSLNVIFCTHYTTKIMTQEKACAEDERRCKKLL